MVFFESSRYDCQFASFRHPELSSVITQKVPRMVELTIKDSISITLLQSRGEMGRIDRWLLVARQCLTAAANSYLEEM